MPWRAIADARNEYVPKRVSREIEPPELGRLLFLLLMHALKRSMRQCLETLRRWMTCQKTFRKA